MSKLEENASLVTALTEIEKKVGQAEIDRDNLKTNLSNKGVDVATTNKMQGLVEKVKDIEVSNHLPWAKHDVWVNAEDCTSYVFDATMSSVNGRAYLIGGRTGYKGEYTDNTVRCYDSNTNKWSDKAKFSGTDSRFTSQAVDDCIYVFGGLSDNYRNTRIYRISWDYWTFGASSPTDSLNSASAVLGNNIYVLSSFHESYHKNECYNVTTNTWTTKSSIPKTSGYSGICCIIDKMIYFSKGGYIHKYNTDTDTWSLTNITPVGATHMIPYKNYIYFFSANFTKCYDTINDIWEDKSIKKAHPNPDLKDFSVCKLNNNVVLVVGGWYKQSEMVSNNLSRYYLI